MLWLERLKDVFREFGPGAGTVLSMTGGLLILIAAGFGLHTWMGVRHLVRATATVSENVSSFAPGGGVSYAPRLRFRTAEGELVQIVSGRSSADIEFPAGTTLPILYSLGDPRSAFIATVPRLYPAALTLGILGIASLDLGLIFWFLTRKNRRENTR